MYVFSKNKLKFMHIFTGIFPQSLKNCFEGYLINRTAVEARLYFLLRGKDATCHFYNMSLDDKSNDLVTRCPVRCSTVLSMIAVTRALVPT